VAKRRVYDIAKDRGMTNQEVLDLLRAGGLDIKSVSSTVEDADIARAFAPTINPGRKARAAAAAAAAQAPVAAPPPVVEDKPPAAQAPAPAEAVAPAPAGPAAESAAESAGAGQQKQPRPVVAAKPPVAKPVSPAVAAGPKPEAAAPPKPDSTAPEPPTSDRPEGQRPEAARPEGPRPAPRKPPLHPRARPRLEDMPTVVGPGVPLRKGVKPSGNVVTKEELVRIQAENEARAEAARKAAAAAPPKPAQPESAPQRGPAPRPAAPPAGAARPPYRAPGPPRDAGDRRDRAFRPAAAPAREVIIDPVEVIAPAAAPRPAGPSRVRRGEDKPARRRVIIDSQASRKGGRGGPHDRRNGPISDADKPAMKKKALPGTESPAKVKSGASVKDLGEALEISAGELIKTLLKLGEMVTITQSLSDDAIAILAEEFERQVEIEHAVEEKEGADQFVDDPADLTPRAPVVTIMGHVDHGKTSLLDAIRETEVVKSEAGGITQHIGAYQVTHNERKVTFLDTPGHEAFTAMRARGAKSTDIAVIVVAANDGVMPQTLEAISHAKAAEVPMVVAINKMDLADANPDQVKRQLADQGLVPEAWGGETVMVEVSAKQKTNLDDLMDMILLVADVQELKANAKAPASGVVIEAQLDVGRGPMATILVQRGTLRVGDAIVSGEAYGKVKAMFDFTGAALSKATPSMPAQVLGFNSLPVAGDFVMVSGDEREARQRADHRTTRLRQEQLAKSRSGASSLDEFYRRLKEGRVKELPLVIKGDVGGSVEALEEALRNITHPEVKVEVVFAGVGGINESDIMLASASKAVVIGFNVRPSVAAKALAEQEGVDVRTYRVIYKAIEDVEAALVGLLEPEKVEEELGSAEIRQVFRASRIGTIAGCYVLTGKIIRSSRIRLVRNGSIIHEGSIGSLKRFNDDVREVLAGYECGLHVDGYDDIHEGDIVEAYEIKEVARTQ
jgi:translation initiation factor IF-2